ncbi:MAG: PT domain-containing protein [Chloroflexi bacterium]|nr:PT domain-containing protein [Chloroflexota bacterium]
MAMIADVPARPDGLELIGEMEGSGYRTPPALVRRQDGQTLQLTPLLYAVLEAVDGRRGYEEIAKLVAERTGRKVSATDVQTLAEEQLRTRGLLLNADGTAPELKRSNPLTGLKLKVAVTDPAVTRRLTDPFAALFHPLVWIPLLVVFGWVAWWLLVDRGLASATYQAFQKPDLLILVIVVTILSAGFHEFGHAAAARRGGGQPGVMGAGWFLLWPAFYTDVTDTYRLGRGARLRTDLGGLYFNAIVAVVIAAAWWLTGWDALLLVIAAQMLQMIRQLAPLVRFDGYHVLADVTGVPDLFSRIGPILTSFWPGRWNDPRVAQLKWWVRAIVTLWVLVVVPLLLIALLAMIFAAPRLIGTALESIGREWSRAEVHWTDGRLLDAAGAVLAIGVVALPILAIGFVFGRVVYSIVRGLWRRTEGRPVRRTGAGALMLAGAVALALVWWPNSERYQPIRPYEDGTIFAVANVPLAAAAGADAARPTTSPRGGEVVTVLPSSDSLPTEDEPQMALVLIPRGTDASVDDVVEPAWVFPFNEPLPPEIGDNQALAVNTTDGSVQYDVAVAMVWVTGDDPVLNTNEAYAFASCADCVTVAVAFQVVVIVGSADVIIPQNLSAAVNYECFECITAAVASQLVVTIDSLPDEQQQIALADLWEEIAAFAETIPTLPLSEVIARLEDYKEQILTILDVAPRVEPSPSASSSPGASGSPSPSPSSPSSAEPSATASPTPQPSASPQASPAGTGAPSPSPSATPTGTPRASSTPTPTPSPSPTPSP